MGFQSILGMNKPADIKPEDIVMPKFFYDLNLDQVVQDIMEKQKIYDIRRFYYEKATPEDVKYRLEVLHDIEKSEIYESIVQFSLGMRTAKRYLDNIQDVKKVVQKQKLKLDCAAQYINSVVKLDQDLNQSSITSRGLVSLKEWLHSYISSENFCLLKEKTEHLISEFKQMKFNLCIKRDRIIVEQDYLEEDYCNQLQEVFGKDVTTKYIYHDNPFTSIELSPFEEKLLVILKKFYKQTFKELEAYNKKFHDFIHCVLSDFETEVQFYIAFKIYRDEMEEMNFHFCYPQFSEDEFTISEGYDLALARKNYEKKKMVVFNDCQINQGEKFLVITGPNQGGKTTYARALGQIIYFSTIGLMIPARMASIPVFDNIYTHFAADESMETGSGKLKEELNRLKVLMEHVTKNSFVIFNEIFTSATSYDAYIMGKRVIDYFIQKECLGIYVTHIHELTKADNQVVSMVATLLSDDSNIRTFKIVRKAADGRSYANTIVEKYHMSYNEIKEQISQ